jgi:hypothetical protein
MANGHGGARAGAGKPKGASTRRAEQSMAMAEAKGVDPVEMLLDLTKWAFEQFTANQTRENADMVRDYAKEAAPYVRPKLSAVEASGPNGGAIVFEGLDREIIKANPPSNS